MIFGLPNLRSEWHCRSLRVVAIASMLLVTLLVLFTNSRAASARMQQAEVSIPESWWGSWGFINRSGKVVITLSFNRPAMFKSGIAIVSTGDRSSERFTYIDVNGNRHNHIVLNSGSVFNCNCNGFFVSIKKKNDVTFLPLNGEQPIPFPPIDESIGADGPIIAIRDGAKFKLADCSGRSLSDRRYDGVGHYADGLLAVRSGISWGFVDQSGNIVIPLKFKNDGPPPEFHEGLARFSVGKKVGFVDSQGHWVIPAKYDAAHEFHEGLAAVETGERWGFISPNGSWIVKPQYGRARSFSDGLAAVAIDRGADNLDGRGATWGYIDKQGHVAIKPKFYYARNFSEGLALVGIEESGHIKYGYLNHMGQFAIAPTFENASDFSNGYAAVLIRNGIEGRSE